MNNRNTHSNEHSWEANSRHLKYIQYTLVHINVHTHALSDTHAHFPHQSLDIDLHNLTERQKEHMIHSWLFPKSIFNMASIAVCLFGV